MRLNEIVSLVAQHGAERHLEKKAHGIEKTALSPLVAIPAGTVGALGIMGAMPGVGIGVGTRLPGVVRRMHHTYEDTQAELDRASRQQLDDSVAMKHAGIMDWLPTMGKAQEASQAGVGKGIGSLAAAPMTGIGNALGSTLNTAIQRNFFRDFGERKDPGHLVGTGALQTFGKEIGSMGAGLLRDMASKAMSTMSHMGDDAARQAILQQLKREDPILAEGDDKILMEAFHTMSRFAPVLSTDKNAVRSFLRQAVMSGHGPDYASIKLLADSEYAVTPHPKE